MRRWTNGTADTRPGRKLGRTIRQRSFRQLCLTLASPAINPHAGRNSPPFRWMHSPMSYWLEIKHWRGLPKTHNQKIAEISICPMKKVAISPWHTDGTLRHKNQKISATNQNRQRDDSIVVIYSALCWFSLCPRFIIRGSVVQVHSSPPALPRVSARSPLSLLALG